MNSLTVDEVRSLDRLDPDLAAWDAMVGYRPMRSPIWLLGWWKHFANSSKELRILVVRDNGELVGIAPLYEDRIAGKHVLRMLGAGGNVCTDHTTWFARERWEAKVGHAVAKHSLNSAEWSRIHLEAIDANDRAMASTLEQFALNDYLSHCKPRASCWSLQLPETWEDYLAVLSKSHRKRCRRLIRSYFDTGRVVIHDANEENFLEVWEQFLDLHAQRWGDSSRPAGCFTDPRFGRFHKSVAQELLRRDQLRLCYLTCDGQPIAAEYQFFDRDTLYAYQSGMAHDAGHVQPGNLSLIATIQHCIHRGLQSIDLLRGNESYKAHWRADAAACHDIRIWPNGIVGRIELGMLGAKQIAQDWLRKS